MQIGVSVLSKKRMANCVDPYETARDVSSRSTLFAPASVSVCRTEKFKNQGQIELAFSCNQFHVVKNDVYIECMRPQTVSRHLQVCELSGLFS